MIYPRTDNYIFLWVESNMFNNPMVESLVRTGCDVFFL